MLIAAPPPLGMTSGGANGSRPTSSCGGPWAISRSRLSRSVAESPPSVRADGVEHVRVGAVLLAEREADELERGAVLAQDELAVPGGAAAANSSITGR